MKLRGKSEIVDAVPFTLLNGGYREPWVSVAICSGDVYMQGGEEPYWTVNTPSGTLQMSGTDWLVRYASGGLYVYEGDEINEHFEYGA